MSGYVRLYRVRSGLVRLGQVDQIVRLGLVRSRYVMLYQVSSC
jgi:hypothetical protein